MSQTFVYQVGNGLYINLTNACTCDCDFCERRTMQGVGSAGSLWLDHEPTADEVLQALAAYDLSTYDELVFCGFGEPTLRLDVLLQVAQEIKSRQPSLPIRVNTNGHASLIAGRDITPRLAGVIDVLSISLNRPDAASYSAHMLPVYGESAFAALLDFAAKAAQNVPRVVLTAVDVIDDNERQKCEKLAQSLGVEFRLRPFH